MLRIVGIFALGSLAALAAVGCTSNIGEPEAVATESEISTVCTLGGTCPAAIKVVSAVPAGTVPHDDVRDDVTVGWQGNPEFSPAPFAGATSRPLKMTAGTRVVLSGSADGKTPFVVDDFLLVEIVGTDGARIANGVVNANGLALDGQAVRPLAPIAVHNGANLGWSYNQVDITSLLPTDRSFRVRVTALDVTGVALVSDVYLVAQAEAEEEEEDPSDPLDPASCQGPTWSGPEALAKFAPATTKVKLGRATLAARTRQCGDATGCNAWTATTSIPFRDRSPSDLYGRVDQAKSLSIAGSAATSYVGLHLQQGQTEGDRIRFDVSFLGNGGRGVGIEMAFNSTGRVWGSEVRKCTKTPCGTSPLGVAADDLDLDGNYTKNRAGGGLDGPHVVTAHCARLRGVGKVRWSNNLGWNETEYAILARY